LICVKIIQINLRKVNGKENYCLNLH
jgi:hypothetical protein